MERREFLGWVGIGVLATSLPVAIAACSDDTKADSDRDTLKADAEGFVTIGTVKALDGKGSILNDKLEVIVVRNPETKKIVALNPVCPHKGCNVEWEAEEKILECPCHDSKFALDGKLLAGPAKESLATYAIKQKEDSILVKVS